MTSDSGPVPYDLGPGDSVHRGKPVTVGRYTVGARINHWITATTLVLLALSGLSLFHPSLFFLTGLFGGGQWTRAIHPWLGVLLFFSFPKFGHAAVAWVALAPLLLALHGARPRQGLRLGFIAGAVSAFGTLYWTSLVVTQYGGLSLPVGVMIMVLLGLAFAVFPALFGAAAAAWSRESAAAGSS